MKYWSRENTKEWIAQLESRLQDIEFYLDRTWEWCEEQDIEDDRVIFMCAFLTCVWVSHLRGESISFIELMEMLDIAEWECDEDKFYELDDKWANLDHDDLLEQVVAKCNEDYWEDDDED